ncbi:MAG: hypothetical protein ACRDG4_02965, partial [Chloroflexota bacterium]
MAVPAYRTHPVHELPGLVVGAGYDALAARLRRCAEETGPRALVVIDGFVGAEWVTFTAALTAALDRMDLDAHWYSTEECFLPPSQIDALLAPT